MTKNRLAMLTFTSIYLTILLAFQYVSQSCPEPIIFLPQIDEQVQRLSSTIEVGLHINKFSQFSFEQQLFLMEAIAWFKFPQATEALEIIEQFSFQNSLLLFDGSLVRKSPPLIKLRENDVIVAYNILVNFKTEQIFKQFPLTAHRLNFILENTSVMVNEVNFISKPENFTLSENISVETWFPQATFARGGYVTSVINSKDSAMNIDCPAVAFSIDFKGTGARDLFSLYFPLLVVFFIVLLGLLIDIASFTGLCIVTSSVPMLVLFRLVIQSGSPNVAYMTHIDYTFYVLVFLSLLILAIKSYMTLETQRLVDIVEDLKKNAIKEKLEKIDSITFFSTPIILMILMTLGYFR